MQTETAIASFTSLQFEHLPRFAHYLLTKQLQAFIDCQLQHARELNVPLLKLLERIPPEQLQQMMLEQTRELLQYLERNEASQLIELSVKRWVENQLPQIDQHQVVSEDITLINLSRKRAFLHFAVAYYSDVQQLAALISEIDLYNSAFEIAATNTYISLLQAKIDEHSHFIHQINNTTPGAIYVFDLVHSRGVYSNGKLKEILGYDSGELNSLGDSIFNELIHPDDLLQAKKSMLQIRSMQDGQINSYKFRIRLPNNEYRWIRVYESVFKRDTTGAVTQTIAIALNVDREKRVADQLLKREHQLLEAQEIAQVGSFVWHLQDKILEGTPKLYQLLQVEWNDYKSVIKNIHADDQQKVVDCFNSALKTGKLDCEFRYNCKGEQRIYWTKAVLNYTEDGQPANLTGTLMNVTERSSILENLRQSESRYRLAEALAHIGHYEVDIASNKVKMSEELFRIYGLEPQEEAIDYSITVAMRHPDDDPVVKEAIRKAVEEKRAYDFYFRIIANDGVFKIVRGRGEVFTGEDGQPVKLVGTIQDVTEKQQLIERLKHSEYMYKQAEALANMGNYSMNTLTNEIEWTDQLYKIYGLEPQSEKITLERFYQFIHPDDRAQVDTSIEAFYKNGLADYTFRIVTTSGEIKILRSIAQLQNDDKGRPVIVIGTEQDITEHRRLVESLEKSQWLNKQAQSIARLGNWSYNVKTGESTWSEEMYRIYELPETVKVNFDLFVSFIHPDDRDEVLAYYQDCLRNKKSYNKRHRIVLRNGKVKTLHRKGELRLDADGEVEEFFGTTQDITEQQAIENELREKQNFIQKIADAAPSIIASYNVNTGKYVFVNKGVQKLLGYEPGLLLERGMSLLSEVIHPDDLQPLVKRNNEILEESNKPENCDNNNVIADFTYRMRHKDGQYRWFHTYGTIFDRNSNGLVEHLLNITLDITEQVEANEKIKDQEHFIQQIADASPTILYLFNAAENKFEYINREVFYVLGYTSEEVLQAGNTATTLLYHPEDFHLLPERKESDKRFQHTDSMMQYECRMKNKAGDWCWVLVREVIFKTDEKGEVVEILGAALDITKRKEMEKTLVQNAFQLEQSNASLEEFAYVASHDLKEPLRKISTFGDRLLQTQMPSLTEDGKVYLKKIVDASQRMQLMISDLLSISMITGDRAYEPYSLQAILDEVLQTLEYKIEQKAALIQSEPLPVINMVPTQFRQLFQNLLSNSLKFVRDGVQPQITISHSFLLPHEVAHLQLKKGDAYLKLQFTDNGIGFDEEYAGKIFAIFQRLHGRSEYEGTGIGLAICKKIVEHHGGVIWATGQEQQGATFTIVLPV